MSTAPATLRNLASVEAIRLHGQGFWPIAIHPAGASLGGDRTAVGKEPIGAGWGLERRTIGELNATYKRHPGAGVGVCLGPGRGPNGLNLIDAEIDGEDGWAALAELFGGEVPATLGWASTRGGHHLLALDDVSYRRLCEVVAKFGTEGRGSGRGAWHLPSAPGLEFRIGGTKEDGAAKQVQSVCPPTVGTDGQPRRWTGPREIATWPASATDRLEAMSVALLEAKKAEAKKAERPKALPPRQGQPSRESAIGRAIKYLERCDPAISGQGGHDRLFRAACRIGPGFDLDPDDCLGVLREHYNPRCSPPWSEAELAHKVKQAYEVEEGRGFLLNAVREQPQQTPRPMQLRIARPPEPPAPVIGSEDEPEGHHEQINKTDLGNAKRLVRRHQEDLRHCHPWKSWHVWDGSRWEQDTTGAVKRMAKAVVQSIGAEAAAIPDQTNRKELLAHAISSESKRSIEAMISLAESEPGIPVKPEEWDKDPWLLNCLNGTVDLRTGKLKPHDRSDLVTKVCPVHYDPDAKAPRWEQFEREIFAGDEDLVSYMRRCVGYSLTAVDTVQEINILHGEGSNGKNVYLDTVRAFLGDYACQADPNLLLASRNEAHPTGVADLHGRRFVAASETDDGRKMAIALVKRLTGDATIKARRMRQDFFEFNRTFKVFLATNCKPEIGDTDYAIWRRIRLVPFRVKFVKKGMPLNAPMVMPEEPGLTERLKAEAPGILALFVRGCLEWQERGIDPPAAVIAATEEYRAEMDSIGDFISERCEAPGDDVSPQVRAMLKEKANALFQAYDEWAREAGIEAAKSRKFGAEMERRGYKLDKSNGTCWRKGIRLKPEDRGGSSSRGDDDRVPF